MLFVSYSSLTSTDREGLGKSHTATRQCELNNRQDF